MPTALTITNSSSSVANRTYLTPREEILANFRPQRTFQLLLNPERYNNNKPRAMILCGRVGRPKNVILQLNHILLFVTNSWNEMSPPREHSSIWDQMMQNSHIATNVIFNENTSFAINSVIYDAFSLSNENSWIILNGSASKLKAAASQVINIT